MDLFEALGETLHDDHVAIIDGGDGQRSLGPHEGNAQDRNEEDGK